MFTMKTLTRFVAPFGFGLGVVAADTAAPSATPAPLSLQVYNGDGGHTYNAHLNYG